MRKKIAIEELRLGMHVHRFCGSWVDHPFWRTAFTLRDPKELTAVLASDVTHCWIDSSKGVDVDDAPAPAAVASPAFVAPQAQPHPELPVAHAPRVEMIDEMRRTAAVLQQSKKAVVEMFGEARLGRAVNAESCAPLVESIAASVGRHSGALVSLVRLKTRDDYTYMHSVAVCALMVALARQLGMDEAETRMAGMAGLLHDLGKAAMPIEVLNKPGKLTEAEFHLIQSHPVRGHELLVQSGETSETLLDVCLHHHEKTDGSGYPHRLKGDQISLLARMGAVCDVYDAITSNRPYKAGWDPAEAVGKMAGWRRGHFDETVFKAFVKTLGIYPNGSLVRMRSGRLAVVMEQHPVSPIAPSVKVFFSTRSQMHITPEVLDLSRPDCGDGIVGRESNREWKFTRLDELWAGPEALRQMGHGRSGRDTPQPVTMAASA
jgi:putative nucleotidyltransferase with HDIG domain